MAEMRKYFDKINTALGVNFLVFLHALLFFGFYFTMSYFNRLGKDESLIIYFLNKFGLVYTIKYYYLTAEGNFTSNIVYCIIFQCLKNFTNILVFHVLFLFVLYVSFYLLIYRLSKLQILSISSIGKLLLPMLILSPFFMQNPIITEAWFWPTAMIVYQIPLILLVLGLYFLLSPSKWAKIVAFFIFILFGGTKINYVLMVSSIGGAYFIYKAFGQKKLSMNMLIALSGILIGLVIYLASPSNMMRMKGEAESRNLGSLLSAISYNSQYIFTEFLSPLRLMRIALFMAAFLVMDIKLPVLKIKKSVLLFVLFIIAINALLIIANGAIYFAATGKGVIYQRVWTFNFFILVITIGYLVYLAGIFLKVKTGTLRYKLILTALLLYPSVSYVRAFTIEYDKTKRLAESYDKRIELIKSYKGKTVPGGILYLEPLAETSIINFLELESDPDFSDNRQIALRYGLNCKIAVKFK